MDYADIPAAAALLGANLGAQATRSATRVSNATSRESALHIADLSGQPTQSETMERNPISAVSLLGSPNFYPATPILDPNTAIAQQYYAQNIAASLANMTGGFVNGYTSMYGMLPAAFTFGGAPGALFGATASPGGTTPFGHYEMEAHFLQQQMVNHFSQATPEQQTVYYEGIRQQLHTAASELNDSQKQALLKLDPSLSFSMKPLELDANANFEDTSAVGSSLKRPRTGRNTDSATKKPRKSRASKCESSPIDLLTVEDSPGNSVALIRPNTPRGRPPGVRKTESGTELTPSGKKKSMTPQAEEMRQRKAKMSWPKGTFIIRLQDVKVRNGKDHIWLVDNHQLLQRYNNESGSVQPDGSRVYHKTDRYTGWLCHEGFHYFPLFDRHHILSSDGNTVTVMFPSESELQQAIDYEEQEKLRRSTEAAEKGEEPMNSINRIGLTSSQLARCQSRAVRTAEKRKRVEEQAVASTSAASSSSSTSLQMPRLQPMQPLSTMTTRADRQMSSSMYDDCWDANSEMTSSYLVEKNEEEEYKEYDDLDVY